MREKLTNIGRQLWSYANSNVGSAVIGVTTGYVLSRGAVEEELATAKYKLENSREESRELKKSLEKGRDDIRELQKALQIADSKAFDLLQSKVEISDSLNDCLRQKGMLKLAYDNSSCFFRYSYKEENKNDKINPKIRK